MKSHIHFSRFGNVSFGGFFFFFPFGAKGNMTHASITTLILPPLASSFLDYGTLRGCLEARIPAVCESWRNFWPINCFDLEFLSVFMVGGLFIEKKTDNAKNRVQSFRLCNFQNWIRWTES